MKAKKAMILAVIAASISTGTVSAQAHHHTWADDMPHSNETVNAYVCPCGETKYEDIASIRDYTITLVANGGVLDTPELITQHGKAKLPIPARSSDYHFIGWFTEDGQEVNKDWIYETDTTLYAHWTVTGAYTLYFNSDGGSYIRPMTGAYGTTVHLESYVPIKEGYIFEGWYADPRTKQEQVTEFTFATDEVIYAKWRDDGTAKPQADTRTYLTDEQALAYGDYVDEKTGVPVTALWVQQQERLKQLMEVHNRIYGE